MFSNNSASIDSSKLDMWLGKWEGQLEIFNHTGLTQTVPMAIHHFKTDTLDTYGWFLIYGEDEEAGTRPYFLKVIDENKGHYQIDEKNSILINEYMIGNKMISNFEVMGTLISTVYTLQENGDIIFEIIFSMTDQPTITGDQIFNEEEIPKVNSYLVGGYQKAILKKKLH